MHILMYKIKQIFKNCIVFPGLIKEKKLANANRIYKTVDKQSLPTPSVELEGAVIALQGSIIRMAVWCLISISVTAACQLERSPGGQEGVSWLSGSSGEALQGKKS